MREAAAYYRTSSAANVGEDKDSLKRQQASVQAYAAANGLRIATESYDAAVSGADPIHQREGFCELLSAANGPKTILVENASRFARDLAVQLAGQQLLKDQGYELIPVDAPDYFLDETPTAVMVRQILGAVSEFEKAQVVSKLKAARDRKREAAGKCEGRKSYQELDPLLVKEAKRLRRRSPATGKRRSLRQISEALFELGYATSKGTPFGAGQIQRLVS